METYERIKHLRKKLGISPERISSELGIARSTYYRYESADIDKLPVSIIEPLAKLLYTTPTYLMGWTDNESMLYQDINKKEELTNNIIPIYDPISCGSGGFAEDTIIDYVVIPLHMLKKNKEYFAQKAYGDSMIDKNIANADLIIFEKTSFIENGQVGCFCIDDNEAVCKIYHKDESNNMIMLLPASPKHSPIAISSDNNKFRVIGKLAFVISDRSK